MKIYPGAWYFRVWQSALFFPKIAVIYLGDVSLATVSSLPVEPTE
jgi:hypothetical protein